MRYVFGEWTLDTLRAELSCAGQVRRLRRKAFQVLAYLLAHADRMVSKQELCEQVWPQQFISDAALEGTVRAVRQAIGDSGRDQRLIQTVYGQGYRFITAVAVHPEAPAGEPGVGHLAPRSSQPTLRQGTEALVPELPPQETARRAAGIPETATRAEEVSLQRCASAAAGEWKLVTVLCCALAEPLLGVPREAEPHYRALQALATLTREAVQRYGGTLQPVVGEPLLALFGAPQAQEEHARGAVLAALELLQRLCQPAQRPTLVVRLGVHSGLAVVGEIGPEAHGPVTAVGAPTQVALRLVQQAEPGTLLVSVATYHLVQEEVRGELWGSLVLEGTPEPLPVYAVRGLVQRRAGVPQRATPVRSPFVGRQRELALLYDRLEAARAGEGQVVSLVGPAGIGKTRLLAEFGRGLVPHRVTWVLGQCLAYGQAIPYLPVRDLVQDLCALAASDSLATRTAAIQCRLTALGGVSEEDMALMGQLLDLPVAPELVARLTPEVRQARTFTLLEHLIRQAAQGQPLVLAVENVHWIDPTSSAWLTFLSERLAGMAVLLLVTQRPDAPPPWGARAAVTQLALPPLRTEESQAIVAAVPGTAQLPAARRQQIVAHGAGNPFFLEELAWYAVEHSQAAPTIPVPETVQAVLAARLDRLPGAAKVLLQVAAVLGPEVPLSLLQALAALPEATVQQGLAHLQAAQVFYETRLLPERVYTFKHALTQEVAYGSLLQERRRALHARVVEVIEALAGEQTAPQVERLAHHALRGEVWDKALTYCRQAGEKVMARSAYREAVQYGEQALRALSQLPETHATLELAVDLRLALRSALLPLAAYDQMAACLGEAQTCAETLGDQRRLGRVLSYRGHLLQRLRDSQGAIESGRRARALALALGDLDLQVSTEFFLGQNHFERGDYREAMAYFRSLVASLTGALLQEHFGMVALPAVQARSFLASCLAVLGAFTEGITHTKDAVRIAEAVGHPYSLIHATLNVGHFCLGKGDVEQAILAYEQSRALCHDANIPVLFIHTTTGLGSAYALSGRVAEALPLLEAAVEQATARRFVAGQARRLMSLGQAYVLAGRVDEALARAWWAHDLADAYQERGTQAGVLRLLGQIAAHHGPPEVKPAETYYRQALALAEELGMRPLQAHCHRDLGLLYANFGAAEQARGALTAAAELYRAMEMTFWLPQAETALAQVRTRDHATAG